MKGEALRARGKGDYRDYPDNRDNREKPEGAAGLRGIQAGVREASFAPQNESASAALAERIAMDPQA